MDCQAVPHVCVHIPLCTANTDLCGLGNIQVVYSGCGMGNLCTQPNHKLISRWPGGFAPISRY